MAAKEINREIGSHVGVVDFFLRGDLFAVFRIAFLPKVTASRWIGDEFFESPIAGRVAHLPPLPSHPSHITSLAKDSRQRWFVGELRRAGRLI